MRMPESGDNFNETAVLPVPTCFHRLFDDPIEPGFPVGRLGIRELDRPTNRRNVGGEALPHRQIGLT